MGRSIDENLWNSWRLDPEPLDARRAASRCARGSNSGPLRPKSSVTDGTTFSRDFRRIFFDTVPRRQRPRCPACHFRSAALAASPPKKDCPRAKPLL